MTPVRVPAGPCADATSAQQTAATDANRAKQGFSMLSLPLVHVIEIRGHNRTRVWNASDHIPYFGFAP
jgi:hypothetical protein